MLVFDIVNDQFKDDFLLADRQKLNAER